MTKKDEFLEFLKTQFEMFAEISTAKMRTEQEMNEAIINLTIQRNETLKEILNEVRRLRATGLGQ